MANQPETPVYDAGVYQLEVTDPVEGGAGGKSNLPLLQLANRTAYLKQALELLESGGGPFEYNASAGTLPIGGSDGAGVAGIRRKDYYFVTVPGTVSGVTLQIGDALIAKENDADDISEFIISQSNAELATPTVIGMVKLVQNLAGGSVADACLSVAGMINLFAQKNAPALTGNATTETPSAGDNSARIANTAWVLARLTALAASVSDAISAEALARANADNAEANARADGDAGLNNAKANKTTKVDTNNGLQGGGDLSADRALGIADGGVSNAKIANAAVDVNKIADAAVTPAKLHSTTVDMFRGNSVRQDATCDFSAFQQLSSKTYGQVMFTITRNLARMRPYVRFQFQLRRDSDASDLVRCQLQRNPDPIGGGSWSTIQTITYRLDDGSWTSCIMDYVDTNGTQGDNYYRVVCTNMSGVENYFSDDYFVTIFAVSIF